MEKGEFDYIVDATNAVHSVLLETIEPSQDDLRKVFAIACNTLNQVAAQAEVLEDLRRLAMRQEQFWTEFKEISRNADHFVYGFCRIEMRVLRAAGIDERAAENLIHDVIDLRESIKNFRINPDEVRENLKQLRDNACDIATRLHRFPIEREEKRQAKKRLKKLTAGISGTAMTVIDAGAFALSLGMSLPGTVVSGVIGSALVGASVAIE